MILTTYKNGNSKDCTLLGDANNESSKFPTRKWYAVNDQNNADYGEGNEESVTVNFEPKGITSNLCDYSEAYILATENAIATDNDANTRVAFKNCALFTKYISHRNEETR